MVALFAMALSAQANEIQSVRITISVNGHEEVQEIPESGMPEVDLTDEATTSFIIKKVEVTASSGTALNSVELVATMYNTSDGTPSSADAWRRMELKQSNEDKATWVLDMGDGIDLIEDGEGGKTKTFELYVQGKNSSSADVFYNNGGNNYKIKFSTDASNAWKVKFYKKTTAGLNLKVDGEDMNINYTGDFVREQYYGWNPGEIGSLVIDGFDVTISCNDGVSIQSVSLQYKVYEEGSEGSWSGLEATLTDSSDEWNEDEKQTSHKRKYAASGLARNVASGLKTDTNYVLELMYQVVTTDGDYIFISRGVNNDTFGFTVKEATGIEDISSESESAPSTRYNLNGQPVDEDYTGIVIENGKKVIIVK